VSTSIFTITIDCANPKLLATFWSELLDYKITFEEDDEVAIERSDEVRPAVLFIRVPDKKTVKNRIHLDLNPDDQDAEVRRAKALGASEVDIGQKDVSWVVLADPEGNEFCILTPRKD
jgi:predicted enzyme related to lactoylglutathione lyase